MAGNLQSDGAYHRTPTSHDFHPTSCKSPSLLDRSSSGNYACDPLMQEGKEDCEDSNEDEPGIIRRKNANKMEHATPVLKRAIIQDHSLPELQPVISIAFLINYLVSMRHELQTLKTNGSGSTISARAPLDFIPDCLTRSFARAEAALKQQLRVPLSGAWKLCSQLKHYKQSGSRPRGAGSISEPQILCFSNRQFDTAHLPAGIPAEMSDMKLEANRLKSFCVKGMPTFQESCKTGQRPEVLAANGFFYMQDRDRVKCAFCLGVLFDWNCDETVDEEHRLRFSTCPLLLGLDVGNVPIPRASEDVQLSQACSDDGGGSCDHTPPVIVGFWQQPLNAVSHAAVEGRRVRPAVSPATAAAACKPGAADNLEMLARSLQSADAAASYHPMRHPAWRSQHRREDSLARVAQAVPGDLLASAGFHLDAEHRTSCFWCGLQILSWMASDDPWIEHARWSPRCCHLLLERGHEFVLACRASHPPQLQLQQPHQQRQQHHQQAAHSEETDGASPSDVAFISSAGSSPLIDYRIEARYFKAREDFPPTLAILQVGCDQDDARTALFLQLKGTGDDFPSFELFLQSVLTQHSKRLALGISGREFYERTQRDQSLVCNREPQPLGDDEVNWRACKVCMDMVINVTLLDCKHLCCCSNCAKNLDTCPLCRAPIRATMLVNMD